jgi:hypothetical protein
MPEGESWAIATQQSHATGHSPKSYGTAKGRHEAHEKYPTPGDDEQKASPKTASGTMLIPLPGGKFEFHHAGEVHIISKELAEQHFPELVGAHEEAFGKKQKAAPKSKTAGLSSALVGGFCSEMKSILEKRAGLLPAPETALTQMKTTSPKPTMGIKKNITAYSQPKTLPSMSPSQGAQPTAGAPQVRT